MERLRDARHYINTYGITDQEAIGLARFLLWRQLEDKSNMKREDQCHRYGNLYHVNAPLSLESTAHLPCREAKPRPRLKLSDRPRPSLPHVRQ